MAVPTGVEVSFCAATDPGLARANNEDQYRADAPLGFFLVVDGVGGQAAGEVASESVASGILDFIRHTHNDDGNKTWPFDIDPALSEAGNRVRVAAMVANQALGGQIAKNDELTGMAATMAALLLTMSRATMGNVGDCRGYLFRGGALTQVTRDHSWVAEQVRLGLLAPEAAQKHPMRNVVTRALDGEDHLQVDINEFDVQPGDTLLLCSDGLCAMADDANIAACLTAAQDPQDACQRLVAAAKDGGGKDNITVVVVRVPNQP